MSRPSLKQWPGLHKAAYGDVPAGPVGGRKERVLFAIDENGLVWKVTHHGRCKTDVTANSIADALHQLANVEKLSNSY